MSSRYSGKTTVSVAFLGAGVGNLLFHLAAVRSVNPEVYSDFGVLTALVALVTIPLGAVEVTFASAIARAAARGTVGADATVATFRRLVAVPATVVTAVIVLAAVTVLAVPAPQAALLAALLGATTVMALARSLLIGGSHWEAAGVAVLSPAAGRLLALLALLAAGIAPSAGGLIAITVAGESAATAVALHLARRRYGAAGTGPEVCGRDLAVATGALGSVSLLAFADVLMSRLGLTALQVGQVAAASNLARAGLYLPQAIAMGSLPDLSVGSARRASVLLTRAVVVLAGLGLVGVAALTVIGEQLGSWLLGDPAAGRLLPLLAIAALGAGLTQLIVTGLLARRSRGALFPFAFVPFLVLGAVMSDVTATLSAAAGLTVAAVLAGLLVVSRHRRGADRSSDEEFLSSDGVLTGRSISVVVPSYRPGPRFERHLRELARCLAAASPQRWEVVVVDDGCPDGSAGRAEALRIHRLRVIRSPRNRGKGHAVRTGISATVGDVVVFIDADGDIDATQAVDTAARLVVTGVDVVIADKTHPASVVERSVSRRLFTFLWGTLVQLLFGLEVADTQVGLKALRGDLGRSVVVGCREDGFAFDLELLTAVKRAGATIVPAPVRIADAGTSTVRIGLVIAMVRAAVRLRTHRPGTPPSVEPTPVFDTAA